MDDRLQRLPGDPHSAPMWHPQSQPTMDPTPLMQGDPRMTKRLPTAGSLTSHQQDILLSPDHFSQSVGPNGDGASMQHMNGSLGPLGGKSARLMDLNVPSSNFMNAINFEALSDGSSQENVNGNTGEVDGNLEGGITEDGEVYLQQYIG